MAHTFARTFALGLLPLALLAACAAPAGEDVDSSDQDKKISPTDSEDLGRILVDVPSGWTLPVNPSEDATASYRGGGVVLGTASRLKEGTGCVSVTSKFDRQIDTCSVDIKKGKQTTFKLGSLKAAYDASPTGTLARDFGPTPKLQVFHKSVPATTNPPTPSTEELVVSNASSTFWAGATTRPVLAPAGDYRFSFGIKAIDDVSKSLAQNENATLNLNPTDRRATITIKKPSRDLPDAPTGACQTKNRTFLTQRSQDNTQLAYGEPSGYAQRLATSNPASYDGYVNSGYEQGGLVAWKSLPMADDTDLKVFPFVASEAPMHYEVVVNNVAMPLALKPGDHETIELQRIDVDHVAVTKETGEVYNAVGSWQLFRQADNGSWIPMTVRTAQYGDCSGNSSSAQSNYPTGTGVDVFPGTYRVLISYSTAEGAKQQDITTTVP